MTFHIKRKGLSISRMTEKLLYAKSSGQKCLLHFKDGEVLEYNYRLNVFQKKVSAEGFFRVHRYFLLKLCEVIGYAEHQAKLSNNELIPLNDYGYELVKNFVDNKKNS